MRVRWVLMVVNGVKAVLLAAALFAINLGATGCVSAAPAPAPTATGEYLAGRLAGRTNNVDAAARAFSTAHASGAVAPNVSKGAFLFLAAAGDIAGAAIHAEEILLLPEQDDPIQGVASLLLAAKDIKQRRYGAAHARLKPPLGAPFIDSTAILLDAWIESAEAGPRSAAAKISDGSSEIFSGFNALHRAFFAEMAGDLDRARIHYETAVYGLGGSVGRAAYGAFLERSGDVQAARAYYALLARDPLIGRRLAADGLSRIERGRAAASFAKMSPAQGGSVALYTIASAMAEQAQIEQERFREAGFEDGVRIGVPGFDIPLILAQTALYLDPALDDARRLAASIFMLYGDLEKAAHLLSTIRPASPYYESARIDMADALVAREDHKGAVKLLKSTLSRDPGASEVRWALALQFSRSGEQEESIRILSELIDGAGEFSPAGAWRYYAQRGEAHHQMENWTESERDLKRAVELAPDEPVALNALGYRWAERGENLDQAFALINKAVDAEPQNGAFIDSLGWAYYQQADYENAATYLEKAAALEPADPTITDHLGDVYWRLERTLEARYQWSRALELEPTDKLAAAIAEKLKSGIREVETPKEDAR